MLIRIFTLFLFAGLVLSSCSKESLTGSISELEKLDSFDTRLEVHVYDREVTEKENNNCNSGCSTNQATSAVRNANVSLYSSEQRFLDNLELEVKLITDNNGMARFEDLKLDAYYIQVQCSLGEKTLGVNTPKGKLSTISIGL
jgi:hypothetical protein